MSELERVPDGIDTSAPSSARVYDYLLGGKDNYALGRMVTEKLLPVAPDARAVARANRAGATSERRRTPRPRSRVSVAGHRVSGRG
ncbi:SAM-dependent methyltransferase [Microtetraspora niveoalba]|uniref:SAM-dependent methyltransferase n=1 Tax=Microtetraspora niveoalba TaxID=46175 RepID=UPI00082FED7F|nr:SAM-dependent methyltransferase [Microtetraspora niveoalba]